MRHSGVQQASVAQMPRGRFESDTRESLTDLEVMVQPTPGTAGQAVFKQLPTAGYLSDIYFVLQGTTTTTSAQSAVVKAYPAPPWDFIRKIRVYTNMGMELINLSGYELYLYNRVLRGGLDIHTHAAADFLTYAATDGGGNNTVRSRYFTSPTSLGVSSSETWRAGWWLPITWGTAGKAGYQLLQDDAVKYYFEVTFGDLTDLYASTSGTPTLSNVTVTPIVRTFATPRNPMNKPDLSYSKFLLSESQPLTTGSGLNTFKLVTGNMITKMIHVVENKNTVALGAPADPTQLSNIRLDYANTQVPYNLNHNLQLLMQEFRYMKPLPQGVYVWDLAMALGLPELPTMRDVIDTIMLTNLQSEVTVASMTLANSNLRTIKELLVPNRNFGG